MIFALGGFVLCGTVGLFFLSTLIARFVPIKKKLSLRVTDQIDSHEVFGFTLHLSNYFLLPLVQLRLIVSYKFGGNRDGSSKVNTVLEEGHLSDVLYFCFGNGRIKLKRRFSHRGLVNLVKCRIQFGDLLGLTLFTQELSLNEFLPSSDIVVNPHGHKSSNLSFEMISLDAFEDDLLSNNGEKRGAWVDLLPYQPEMGARKIAWKIYARSGELYVREMERTVSFNQEWVLLIIAPDNDDLFVSAFVNYLNDAHAELRIGGCGFDKIYTDKQELLPAFARAVGHVSPAELKKRMEELGDCLVVVPEYLFEDAAFEPFLNELPKVCKVGSI